MDGNALLRVHQDAHRTVVTAMQALDDRGGADVAQASGGGLAIGARRNQRHRAVLAHRFIDERELGVVAQNRGHELQRQHHAIGQLQHGERIGQGRWRRHHPPLRRRGSVTSRRPRS